MIAEQFSSFMYNWKEAPSQCKKGREGSLSGEIAEQICGGKYFLGKKFKVENFFEGGKFCWENV